MSEPVKARMARSCRWHGGITLRQYDEVERYDSRTCIGRFPDATVSQFLNAASAHTAKYGADPKRRAVIVIHCGRLHLVEEEDLTTDGPPARPESWIGAARPPAAGPGRRVRRAGPVGIASGCRTVRKRF